MSRVNFAKGAMGRAGLRPPTLRQDIAYRAEAAGFHLLIALFRALGLDRATGGAAWVARTLGPRLGFSRRARAQLRLAMPELGAARIEEILRGMYDNLGRTVAEYAHLKQLTGEIAARVRFEGVEHAQTALARGKGIVFFSGHFANWELMAPGLQHCGFTGSGVYRAANNPYVDAWILAQRLAYCYPEHIAKGSAGTRRLIELLNEGKCLAMLSDQKMSDGVEARFFGIPAMTPAAPAQLATKRGAALVPVSFARAEGSTFVMRFLPELVAPDLPDREARLRALVQRMNDFLEAEVRARPEQWLWLHRRWGKDVGRLTPASAPPRAADRAAPETS